MKVLNPYIFVGLGGSGGKTLQYLHYYLDQRLKERLGRRNAKSWQFLWFDVPPEPEQLIGDSGIPYQLKIIFLSQALKLIAYIK